MSVLGTYTKQPAEKESYTVNVGDDLIGTDTVKTDGVTVTVEPLGLTIVSHLVISPRIKVWCSGGTDGVKYKVTVTSETDDGRILQDEFIVKIKDI